MSKSWGIPPCRTKPCQSKNKSSEKGFKMSQGDFNPNYLTFLVCPQTKQSLTYDDETQELISLAAGLAYPIRDGIPILLIDEARSLSSGS